MPLATSTSRRSTVTTPKPPDSVPARDAIALEGAKGPYANILVVREQDKDQPWVAKIVKAFHSDEVKKFVQATFKNSIVTA